MIPSEFGIIRIVVVGVIGIIRYPLFTHVVGWPELPETSPHLLILYNTCERLLLGSCVWVCMRHDWRRDRLRVWNGVRSVGARWC